MPTVISGLPAHVLLIHVVVVLVPLGALFTALSAVWPAARRKLGFISPLTCLIAFLFVPITIHAGRWLQHHQQLSGPIEQAIQKHANLGATFWIYALLLLVVSAAVWLLGRRYEMGLLPARTSNRASEPDEMNGTGGLSSPGGGTATATRVKPRVQLQALPQWVSIAVAVVAVAVAVVVTWQLYRVGDAGARVVWSGVVH